MPGSGSDASILRWDGRVSVSRSNHGSARAPNRSWSSRLTAEVDRIVPARSEAFSTASTTSPAVWNRSDTDLASRRITMSSTARGTSDRRDDGGGGASWTIAVMFSKSLVRRYSRAPVSISHITMPSENRSLRRSTRAPRHCSGDR